MDIISFLEIMKRRLILVLLVTVLAMAVSGVICIAQPVKYKAKVVMRIDQVEPETGLSRQDYNSLLMSRQLARTYSEMAINEPILQQLAMSVNLGLSPENLRQMVTVRRVKDLELLEVQVDDFSPDRAAYLANSLAGILQREEQNVWLMSNLRVISPALPNELPAGPDIISIMVTAGLAGLLLSISMVTVLEYLLGRA